MTSRVFGLRAVQFSGLLQGGTACLATSQSG
jgi:hypothetical protein